MDTGSSENQGSKTCGRVSEDALDFAGIKERILLN